MSDGLEPTDPAAPSTPPDVTATEPAAVIVDPAAVIVDPAVTVLSIPVTDVPAVEPVLPVPILVEAPTPVTILPSPAQSNGGSPPGGPPGPGGSPEQPLTEVSVPTRYKRLNPRKNPDNRGFVPTLISTAVWFTSLAVAVTITLYSIGDDATAPNPPAAVATESPSETGFDLGSWWREWRHIAAPAAGALVGLVGGSLFALLNQGYARPDRVDPQVYGEIVARLGSLDAQLPVLCPDSGPETCSDETKLACWVSCNEAWTRRDVIDDELDSRGSRWVLGSGYIDLYRQLHAAEEALFIVEPTTDVVANGLYDDLRLPHENILNWEALRVKLVAGLALIGGERVTSLTLPPAADPVVPEALADGAAAALPAPMDEALGRAILRDVRRAINEFRDGERANLVRARNQLVWTGTITAIAGFALLSLAILAQAPPVAVISGVIYYVVGAGVGLFNQLYIARADDAGEEDFGFARASLLYVPVLSGLAAVGGVMAVALLYYAVDLRPTADEQQQSLGEVFNVRSFGLGVAIAAVFGLTPNLLLDQLNQNVASYRTRLKETSATGESEPLG